VPAGIACAVRTDTWLNLQVRKQLMGDKFSVANMWKSEGVRGMYSGLTAALTRQAT
jgi:hypothetical protein